MDNQRSNVVLIDWLSFTTTLYCAEELIDVLGLNGLSWETTFGTRGYQNRYYFDGISIHFNGGVNMGVWCEMSGQGCRAFESFGDGNFNKLFELILAQNKQFHITRIDIAYDDYDGILDITTLSRHTLNKHFRSKWNYNEVIQSTNGISIQVGSSKSDSLVRIYDKLSERLSKIRNDKEKEKVKDAIPHWIRVELQLRDDRAKEFIRYIVADEKPIGQVYSGVVRNYLEYGSFYTSKNGTEKFKTYSYWEKFLSHSEKLTLFVTPGVDYNLSNCINYVTNCAGNAVDCLMKIYGLEAFKKLIDKRSVEQNPKYQDLINKYNSKKKGCL